VGKNFYTPWAKTIPRTAEGQASFPMRREFLVYRTGELMTYPTPHGLEEGKLTYDPGEGGNWACERGKTAPSKGLKGKRSIKEVDCQERKGKRRVTTRGKNSNHE